MCSSERSVHIVDHHGLLDKFVTILEKKNRAVNTSGII
jgi:hypothetical protein